MTSSHRPPEDRADAIYLGPVGPIPIFQDDDFRLEKDHARAKLNAAIADAMHSAEELLEGVREHPDEDVRCRAVPRLVARWRTDPRTDPALLEGLAEEASSYVRDDIAIALGSFDEPRVVTALRAALNDENQDVGWSAEHSLAQLGIHPKPYTR
jgi:HEAT repeat protein